VRVTACAAAEFRGDHCGKHELPAERFHGHHRMNSKGSAIRRYKDATEL
jgi:hypothetical protein